MLNLKKDLKSKSLEKKPLQILKLISKKEKENKKITALEKDKERTSNINKKEKNVVSLKIPKIKRTVIQTLPYTKMMENDITMIEKDTYSKTFEFSDINYAIVSQSESEDIFLNYAKILNYFNATVHVQISIINKSLNIEEFKKELLFKIDNEKEPCLTKYKDDYNKMLLKIIDKKENNIIRNKYVTLTIKRNTFDEVVNEFRNLENAITTNFRTLSSKISIVSNNDKVKILKDIFRGVATKVQDFEQVDFNRKLEKNYVAPNYFSFKSNYLMYNNYFSSVLILRNLPTFLCDQLVSQISEIDTGLICSIHINSVSPEKAIKIVNRQITAIEADKIKYTKRARKNNLPEDILPRDMENTLLEYRALLSDMMTKNEKMFTVNLTVMITDENSYEDLQQKVKILKNIASQNVCEITELDYMQEEGLANVLPLGIDKIPIKRTLTTNSTAVLMPFNIQSLNSTNGIFYGLNPRSNELITGDRKQLANANGFILGTSGSGKSVSAKDEISQIYWKYKKDYVVIVDPQGEYVKMANAYGGEVLKISNTTENYVNPLDLPLSYLEEFKNPLALKTDFVITLCELICEGIDPLEKSLIDRCISIIYQDFIETRDVGKTPTLVDFYNCLLIQEEEQSKKLARKIEIYCIGSQNIFAHKTNIDINNRFFVFDIMDLNKNIKPIGMLIMLDNIMNKLTENFKKGIYTWIDIDEMHILLKNQQSAQFLETLFKIARKWLGIPTGITQNIEDLLQSEYGRKMLGNAEYIKLLKQKPNDRLQIAELLDISENQLGYISNAERGSGLICWGESIVPFKTKIPKDTNILELWSTGQSITE